MTNKWIAKAGAAALVLACAGSASAQSNGPSGFSARIGAFFPTNSGASDLGSEWFAFGLDYKLNLWAAPQMGNGMSAYWGISADYYAHGSDSNVPLVINYNLRQGHLVYSLGAGVDFYNIPDINSSSGTGFDAQAAIAYDFNTGPIPIFLQAKYFLAGSNDLRGLGLYVGARF